MEILKMMENLPDYMKEEYEYGNILPYEVETIKVLIRFFNRKKNCHLTFETFGYTEEVLKELRFFYNNLRAIN